MSTASTSIEHDIVVDLVVGILRGMANDFPAGIMDRIAGEPDSQQRVRDAALALAEELEGRLPPLMRGRPVPS
jgi:hypothetical protein